VRKKYLTGLGLETIESETVPLIKGRELKLKAESSSIQHP